MGEHGMRALLPELGKVDMALVGEPTGMQAAVGERGLVVMDCVAHGVRGHAARNEGVNAIDIAIRDIERLRNFRFERRSELLGDIKMTVTQINAGTQHNVIPDICTFVVDVRTNECYSNRQIVDIIKEEVTADVTPRSTRLNSSSIAMEHPLVQRAIELGREPFGSPTLSNQALLNIPTLKMGPGDSNRSHTANEYIRVSEIEEGLKIFAQMLDGLKL